MFVYAEIGVDTVKNTISVWSCLRSDECCRRMTCIYIYLKHIQLLLASNSYFHMFRLVRDRFGYYLICVFIFLEQIQIYLGIWLYLYPCLYHLSISGYVYGYGHYQYLHLHLTPLLSRYVYDSPLLFKFSHDILRVTSHHLTFCCSSPFWLMQAVKLTIQLIHYPRNWAYCMGDDWFGWLSSFDMCINLLWYC